MAGAQRHSGLREFGDMSFTDPLRNLLAACMNEASLSLVGRMCRAAAWSKNPLGPLPLI